MAFGHIPSNMPAAGEHYRIATDVMSQKTLRKQTLFWTYLDACGRPVGDPYGNRTRVSAVKGPRPNR